MDPVPLLYKIRHASLEDQKSILRLYNDHFIFSRWSENYFLRFLNDRARKESGFFSKSENKIVGFVLGRLIPGETEVFCLSTLWVDQTFRGQGLGKKLVQKMIDTVSAEKDIEKIIVHFRDANDLKKYYSRLGFSGHKILGAYSNGDVKHQMEIRIG